MSARDDHPVLASWEDRYRAGSELQRLLSAPITKALDEIDDLRTRTGAVHRIEALRTRAKAAEQTADELSRLVRRLHTGESVSHGEVANVLQRHLDTLKERVA